MALINRHILFSFVLKHVPFKKLLSWLYVGKSLSSKKLLPSEMMKLPLLSLSLLFSLTSQVILLILKLSCMKFVFASTVGNNTDKLALVDFKSRINDNSLGVLASWNDSLHFCHWKGVTCGQKHQRVTSLDLVGQNLYGTISPQIGNLSFLRSLNLASNAFQGGIPQDVGRLFRLTSLNLSHNFLGLEIPVDLSHCSNLLTLDLGYNSISQQIPSQLGSLSKLVILFLNSNNLTGCFPASISNLSSLQQISLSYNHLQGDIPDEIARMTNLKVFRVGINDLSGVFPPSLYNLSSLQVISLTENKFTGDLGASIGHDLPNLQSLLLGRNQFTGPIPVSLSNTSGLQLLDIPSNNFTGSIPMSFGNLQNLSRLSAPGNLLGSGTFDDLSFVIVSLSNCSNLSVFDLSDNQFRGELPYSLTNLSTKLELLQFGGNNLGGTIPAEVSRLLNLNQLGLERNLLSGSIPDSIGKLSKLNFLELGQNKLTGVIPSSFGNLTLLLELYLYNNSFQGSIPSSLGKCKYLQTIHLCHNKFNGTILESIIGLSPTLLDLNMSHNSFTGSLPSEIADFRNLVKLDVSHNILSGDIPGSLGKCLSLEQLYLQSNSFQGTIPDLGELMGIQYFDLSSNNLSGQIPMYMVNFSSLQNLNISWNNLEGEVPVQGVFKNASAIELFGNSKLCGGIEELHLGPCEEPKKHFALKLILLVVIIFAFCFALMMFLVSRYCLRKLKKKPLSSSSFGRVYPKVSYEDLLNATGGFSKSNLIGSGSFGTVYKGIICPEETTVAIKVLNLQQRGASKSFLAECQALGNIWHRNLVKVLTACSSIDFEGNEFKALVYEFMPNGSLENWLHPEEEQEKWRNMDLLQRINIATDVALALHYLHNQCQAPIVHCDLKPSNVLLDDDLTAHVSDFGLATILLRSSKDAILNHFSSAGIKGTIGYVAPEYGMGGQVSTRADVYSYGILLLEMFTGRKPTDGLFKNDLNLHKFVKAALPGRVMEIVDQSMDSNEMAEIKSSEHSECLISIFQLGIACSAESQRERMDMREVASALVLIREGFLQSRKHEHSLEKGAQVSQIRVKETYPCEDGRQHLHDAMQLYQES
ncbi:hypothetical protein ACSBR1_033256 [Camellia fascicularis]